MLINSAVVLIELVIGSGKAPDHAFCISFQKIAVAIHLGVKMADTLSFTAKVDMVDF